MKVYLVINSKYGNVLAVFKNESDAEHFAKNHKDWALLKIEGREVIEELITT